MARKKTKLVPTTENWHPTENGAVEVTLSRDGPNNWRVSVWGADDFGMEKDGMTLTHAMATYRALDVKISQSWLRNLGFSEA